VIDVQNAYELVRLCDFTYLETSQIPQALSLIGIDPMAGNYQAFYDPSTQAFAYYVEAGGAAFVVFRGTELNWQNIGEDADFFPSDEIVGQVDDGFQIPVDAVWSEVHDFVIARQATTSLPLYITGHSLGAAMASIATARALLDTTNGTIAVTAFYAMGSPRVGNQTFANGIADAMQADGVFFGRVVNDCDPVTNVPERVGPDLIPFYQHISLDTDENDFVDWLPSGGPLSFSIPLDACPLAGFDYDLGEHLTPAYIAALLELL
jgi:triacylglycerol lipase